MEAVVTHHQAGNPRAVFADQGIDRARDLDLRDGDAGGIEPNNLLAVPSGQLLGRLDAIKILVLDRVVRNDNARRFHIHDLGDRHVERVGGDFELAKADARHAGERVRSDRRQAIGHVQRDHNVELAPQTLERRRESARALLTRSTDRQGSRVDP